MFHSLCFEQKAVDGASVVQILRLEKFDGDSCRRVGIPRQKHNAHPARADQPENFKTIKLGHDARMGWRGEDSLFDQALDESKKRRGWQVNRFVVRLWMLVAHCP